MSVWFCDKGGRADPAFLYKVVILRVLEEFLMLHYYIQRFILIGSSFDWNLTIISCFFFLSHSFWVGVADELWEGRKRGGLLLYSISNYCFRFNLCDNISFLVGSKRKCQHYKQFNFEITILPLIKWFTTTKVSMSLFGWAYKQLILSGL